jgi:hypothetical protein
MIFWVVTKFASLPCVVALTTQWQQRIKKGGSQGLDQKNTTPNGVEIFLIQLALTFTFAQPINRLCFRRKHSLSKREKALENSRAFSLTLIFPLG